jgi:hypothetical protein
MALTLTQYLLSYMVNNDDSLPDNELIDDLAEHIDRDKAERLVEEWFARDLQLICDPMEKDRKGWMLLAELGL